MFTFSKHEGVVGRNIFSWGVFNPFGVSTLGSFRATSPSFTTVYSTISVRSFSTASLFGLSAIVWSEVQEFDPSSNSFLLTTLIAENSTANS